MPKSVISAQCDISNTTITLKKAISKLGKPITRKLMQQFIIAITWNRSRTKSNAKNVNLAICDISNTTIIMKNSNFETWKTNYTKTNAPFSYCYNLEQKQDQIECQKVSFQQYVTSAIPQ